jgi:hypothetical protein
MDTDLTSENRQVTKRCHWVPQAYLRDFAANEGRTKIWRFSNKSGDPELKPIEKVAVRHHLYVPRDASTGKRDDSFEQKLSQLEGWFANPLWRALQTEALDLCWKELRMLVSLVVSVMYLRTPIHYEYVKEFHRKMVTTVEGMDQVPTSVRWDDREIQVDSESWPAYRDASEDDLKELWISQMNGATEYAEILMGMRWSMLLADGPTFITSDNPVAVVHPSLTFRGLSNPETLVLFPISPQRILLMDHRHDQPANQYYPLQGNGTAQNVLIWRNAIEYMFSHQDPDDVCRLMVAEADSLTNS